jgi:hypothetical protein
MKYEKEISRDGQSWKKVILFSALPIHPKTRYVLVIKNLILFGFRNLKNAKKQLRLLREELDKIGIVMELAGLRINLYIIKDISTPDYEKDAIDADFEEL